MGPLNKNEVFLVEEDLFDKLNVEVMKQSVSRILYDESQLILSDKK